MKIFNWDFLEVLNIGEHSNGQLIVIAENLQSAIEIACKEYEKELREYMTKEETEEASKVFREEIVNKNPEIDEVCNRAFLIWGN